MSEDRGKLTTVVWQELFPWIILGTALRLAFNLRALMLAAIALVGVVAGWRVCGTICDRLFLPSPESRATLSIEQEHLQDDINRLGTWPWDPRHQSLAWQTLPIPSAVGVNRWFTDNPTLRVYEQLTAPFVGLFNLQGTLSEFVFLLLCALWELAVWAFFGGAITRLAAVALTREESLPWNHLTDYARGKWTAYFAAPLFPLIGVGMAAIPLAILGLLLRSDFGLIIAGLLWFLVLLTGFFMSVLLVGLFFGWPLMWATISTEGTDSFDALSRSYAYTYQRPLQYFFYVLVTMVLGVLGWFVVSIFVSSTLNLGLWGCSWLSGHAVAAEILTSSVGPLSAEDVSTTGLMLIRFWINVLTTLATGFMFSYFWSASTAVYLLLRRHVDATEMDEVFVPDEGESFGLPPLKTDITGVPGAADLPPSAL